MTEVCTHLDQVREVTPSANGCEDCLRIGGNWVHLRLCLICGHVGCCDSSKNKHATKHFHAVKHPLVRSLQPGESWACGYVDETMHHTQDSPRCSEDRQSTPTNSSHANTSYDDV